MKRYLVTCLNCGESDSVAIDDTNHRVMEYEKQANTNLLAMRWRRDLQWGIQCKCGNDNRLAALEKNDVNNLVQGDPISIQKIVDSLSIPDDKQFRLVEA